MTNVNKKSNQEKLDEYPFMMVVCNALEDIRHLIEKGADAGEICNKGFTLLTWAAKNGKLDIVKYFVEECGINIWATDGFGYTPLMQAEKNNRQDVIDYLEIKSGIRKVD
jgi:hypothetical protein